MGQPHREAADPVVVSALLAQTDDLALGPHVAPATAAQPGNGAQPAQQRGVGLAIGQHVHVFAQRSQATDHIAKIHNPVAHRCLQGFFQDEKADQLAVTSW